MKQRPVETLRDGALKAAILRNDSENGAFHAVTAQHITKSEMAKRMKTSRAQLDRLLDPDNDKVQLDTMQRAATAVGRKLQIELT